LSNLAKTFSDTKHRAVSLGKLSFLLPNADYVKKQPAGKPTMNMMWSFTDCYVFPHIPQLLTKR